MARRHSGTWRGTPGLWRVGLKRTRTEETERLETERKCEGFGGARLDFVRLNEARRMRQTVMDEKMGRKYSS